MCTGWRKSWQVYIAPNTQQGAGLWMWPWKDYGYQLSGYDEEGSTCQLGELLTPFPCLSLNFYSEGKTIINGNSLECGFKMNRYTIIPKMYQELAPRLPSLDILCPLSTPGRSGLPGGFRSPYVKLLSIDGFESPLNKKITTQKKKKKLRIIFYSLDILRT